MPRGWKHILVTCTTIGVTSVCSWVTSHSKVQEMAQAALPEVEVVQVAQQDVPITSEWIGTLAGMVNADDQGAGNGLPAQAELHRRCLCHAGPGVV